MLYLSYFHQSKTTIVDFKFINTEYIETVSGGDKEIVKDLVSIFRDQADEFTAEMKLLLEKKDYFNLGLLAHKAKSSVAIVGMTDLAGLLKTFELEAKAGSNTGNYDGYISRFETETRKAVQELESYIAGF